MNDLKDFPLISCLCVSHNSIEHLSRAIECFGSQTYPHKQLVIAYGDDNIETKTYVRGLQRQDILPLEFNRAHKYSLGEKRNLSVECSDGDYFCIWDDDDWYHPERLFCQFEGLQSSYKEASILVYETIFDKFSGNAYGSLMRPLEHSVLCRKDVFLSGARYTHKDRGEDFDFIALLLNERLIFPVINPSLYIYVYHGRNTFGASHFEDMFYYGHKLSNAVSLTISQILSGELPIGEGAIYLKGVDFLKSFNYFNRFPFK